MKKLKVTYMAINSGETFTEVMSEAQFKNFEQGLIDGTSGEFLLNCEEVKEDVIKC